MEGRRQNTLPHLNAFVERPVIKLWAQKLGFSVVDLIDGKRAVEGSNPLGHARAIFAKL